MKDSNWMGIDKRIVSLLPKDRAYTKAEALLSLSYDLDNLIYNTGATPHTVFEAIELIKAHCTFSGYAALWGWSRNKTRKFINDLGSGQGHAVDGKGTGKRHYIRLIINNVDHNADRYRTEPGQEKDTSIYPPSSNLHPEAKQPSRAPRETDEFKDFYDAYPKKRKRPDALRAWNKIDPSLELVQEIMRGLDKAMMSEEWDRDAGRYIPHPAKWLNAESWKDDYTPTNSRRGKTDGINTKYPVDIYG